MQPKHQAGKRLHAQHTVRPPRLRFEEAARKLGRFYQEHENLTREELPPLVARDRELQDAALAFLKYRYTPLDLEASDFDEPYTDENRVAIAVCAHVDAARKEELLQVLLNLALPANHQALWPVALAAASPARGSRAPCSMPRARTTSCTCSTPSRCRR